MPAIAYFFMDGPWRCCWVRYGYDPRKDPIARTYQELEIRSAAIQAMIEMFPSALRKAAASHPAQYAETMILWVSPLSFLTGPRWLDTFLMASTSTRP